MSDERLDFGVLLAVAYAVFVAELRAALAELGYGDLHRSFGYVARAVSAEPLTLRELALRLDLTSQGALKIVDDMQRHGYLERLPDRRDGRAKRLRLSRRGKAALAAARRFHAGFEARLAGRFGKVRVAECRALLSAVVEHGALVGVPTALRPV